MTKEACKEILMYMIRFGLKHDDATLCAERFCEYPIESVTKEECIEFLDTYR